MVIYSAGTEFLIFNLVSFLIFLIIYVSINVSKIKSNPKYIAKYKEPIAASSPNSLVNGVSLALKNFLPILYQCRVTEANIENLNKIRAAYKRLLFFGSKVFEIDRIINNERSKTIELKKKLEENRYDLSSMSALTDANSTVLFNQVCNIIFNSMTQEEKLLATFIKGTDTFVKKRDLITFYTKFFYVEYNTTNGNLYLKIYDIECEKKLEVVQCSYPSSSDDIAYTTWLHARNDGGPDRRFSTNYKIYYVYRGKLVGRFGNKNFQLHYNNKSSTEIDETKFNDFVNSYNAIKIITYKYLEQPSIKKENIEKIKAEYTQHVNIQNTSKYLKITAGTIESYKGIHSRDLEFPDKVEEVGYNAFEDAKIGKVIFNEKCKKISSSAFKNSTISEINKDNFIEEISFDAFKGCKCLTEIHLPKVKNIWSRTFEGCTNLKKVYVSSSLESVYDCGLSNNGMFVFTQIPGESLSRYTLEKYRVGIDIADTLTSQYMGLLKKGIEKTPNLEFLSIKCGRIPDNFIESGKIDKLNLNDTCEIGKKAFQNQSLSEVNIKVKKGKLLVKESAFRNNTPLTKVIFDFESFTIESNAFSNCPNLEQFGPFNPNQIKITDKFVFTDTSFGKTKINNMDVEVDNDYFTKLASNMKIQNITLIDTIPVDKIIPLLTSNHLKTIRFVEDFKDKSKTPNYVKNIKHKNIYNDYIRFGAELTYLELHESIININKGSFPLNSLLETVILTDRVRDIPLNTFENTKKLKKVVLSDKVKNLDGLREKYPNVKFETFNGKEDIIYTLGEFIELEDMPYVKKIIIPKTYEKIHKHLLNLFTSAKEIEIENGVKEICDNAFTGYSEIKSITFPKSIIKIGMNIFEGCNKLEKVVFKNGLKKLPSKIFFNCKSLKKVVLPDGLEEIEDYAFSNTNIESIDIPNTVTKIGQAAFKSCESLNSIELGENVTSIGKLAFYGCKKLKTVTMKSRIECLSESIFSNSGITSIVLPDTVKEIKEKAFEACSKLKTITLSENLTSIDEFVFSECKALKEIELPKGINKISDSTFAKCTALEKVTVNGDITIIGNQAFMGTKINDLDFIGKVEEIGVGSFEACENITDLVIPYTLQKIEKSAFAKCIKLKTINIPSSVKIIANNTFMDCVSLSTIIGMDKIEEIWNDAFKGCCSIEKLVFPRSLKVFDNPVSGCSKLSEIIFTNDLQFFSIYDVGNKFRRLVLPANIDEFKFQEYGVTYNINLISICTIRGANWRNNIRRKEIEFEYMKKEEYETYINNVLLENGYTIGYSKAKIKFKSEKIEGFNFTNDAFSNTIQRDEMYNEKVKEKKRASFDTTLVSEGKVFTINNDNAPMSYEVEENISIILPFEDRITENEISINNLSDNSITSNIFVVEYDFNFDENTELYSCFVNQNDKLISTIDKISAKSKFVPNLKMQFELLSNAENGNVLFKVYSKEQKLLYEEIYFIDRAFTFDDDFGLF